MRSVGTLIFERPRPLSRQRRANHLYTLICEEPFNDQPQVAAYAAQYRGLLDHPGLHQPVPGPWLHATVLRIGFIEDFNQDEMLEVAARLEPKLAAMHMPDFLLGQWWIWGGNPCVHFTPEGPLNELFGIVVNELSAAFDKDRLPQALTFTPHITLAYSKTYNDEIGLFNQLQTKGIDAAPVQVNSLSLVKQRVIDDYYTWDLVKEIPVGQRRSSEVSHAGAVKTSPVTRSDSGNLPDSD